MHTLHGSSFQRDNGLEYVWISCGFAYPKPQEVIPRTNRTIDDLFAQIFISPSKIFQDLPRFLALLIGVIAFSGGWTPMRMGYIYILWYCGYCLQNYLAAYAFALVALASCRFNSWAEHLFVFFGWFWGIIRYNVSTFILLHGANSVNSANLLQWFALLLGWMLWIVLWAELSRWTCLLDQCRTRTYLQSKTGESIMIQDSPDAIKNMNPGEERLHFKILQTKCSFLLLGQRCKSWCGFQGTSCLIVAVKRRATTQPRKSVFMRLCQSSKEQISVTQRNYECDVKCATVV